PKLQQRAREAFEVSCGERHWESGPAAIRRDDKDGVHFDWQFSGPTGGSLLIRSTWLRELARGHRQYFSVLDEARHVVAEQMLDAGHDSVAVQPAAQAVKAATQHTSRQFLSLGVEHIATGYDHVLFLLGLL